MQKSGPEGAIAAKRRESEPRLQGNRSHRRRHARSKMDGVIEKYRRKGIGIITSEEFPEIEKQYDATSDSDGRCIQPFKYKEKKPR